ncbi:helix-turn-helix domain-containing protein [Streptococcus oralis]|uniref:helix-turn-helix domain-containing protein n=1 Tax=Streptococcus oralis TaxID=1303 RepID=UPI0020009CFD|nr:helix-turn-helix transcriptional regulator [Streptococcus oralis]
MNFKDRLKQLRLKNKLTQQNIANHFQTSPQSYAQWEKGLRKPSAENLQKLADYFNVSTDYLLGKTDIPEPDLEIDLDTAIDNSVAYDGTPITDNDREIIKDFLKEYFANKK